MTGSKSGTTLVTIAQYRFARPGPAVIAPREGVFLRGKSLSRMQSGSKAGAAPGRVGRADPLHSQPERLGMRSAGPGFDLSLQSHDW